MAQNVFALDNELRGEFLSGYKLAQILLSLPPMPDGRKISVPIEKMSESQAPVRPAPGRPIPAQFLVSPEALCQDKGWRVLCRA